MSQERIELIHQAYDAFNRRDLDSYLHFMDADVEIFPRQAAIEGYYRGHAGIRRWWGDLLDVFLEVVDVRVLGDTSLAVLRFLGHGADSESPFDETVWHVSRNRDGKSVWWRVYDTETEALEAVGLRQ
jgi:ketosteroid isomerase-like protein